jgi:hypothetical protein
MKLTLIVFLFSSLSFAKDKSLTSRSLSPKKTPEYYIEQSQKYFDTLDTYADRESKPLYSSHIIRWEWYPWLYLTGFRRVGMKLDRLLVLYPTRIINRDCRAFTEQPFGRCRVTFHYERPNEFIDIYEEFTFNDQGEITFVEAWSDDKELLPMNPDKDFWAQGANVKRLSTKVPGLGSKDGKIHRKSLRKSSKEDKDLKNLLKRLRLPVSYWMYESIRFLIKGIQ